MSENFYSEQPNEDLLSRLFGTVEELEHESQIRRAQREAAVGKPMPVHVHYDMGDEWPEERVIIV